MKTIREGDALWVPPAETSSRFWLKIKDGFCFYVELHLDYPQKQFEVAVIKESFTSPVPPPVITVNAGGDLNVQSARMLSDALKLSAAIATNLQTWKDTYKQEMGRSPV